MPATSSASSSTLPTTSAAPAPEKRTPLSLEELMRKRKEEQTAGFKPTFLTKEQRALERRHAEAAERQARIDAERAAREDAAKEAAAAAEAEARADRDRRLAADRARGRGGKDDRRDGRRGDDRRDERRRRSVSPRYEKSYLNTTLIMNLYCFC